MSPTTDADPLAGASAGLWVGVLASVLTVATIGYGITASPLRAGRDDAVSVPTAKAMPAAGVPASAPAADASLDVTLGLLAQRLNARPDDAAGWALLARAYAATGRPAEALPAFRRAIGLNAGDADLLADGADAIAALGEGRLDAEARPWIARALQIAPEHVKALALAGSAAFDDGDYATAVRLWERVERIVGVDPKMLAELRASIAQARVRGSLAAPTPTTPTTPTTPLR